MTGPATLTARSLFAALAAGFFLVLVILYMGPGVANEAMVTDADGIPVKTELRGEDGPLAVTIAVRTLSAGMVLLSLALVEWPGVIAALRQSGNPGAPGKA